MMDAMMTASRSSSFAGLAIGRYLSSASQAMKTANGPTQANVPVFLFVEGGMPTLKEGSTKQTAAHSASGRPAHNSHRVYAARQRRYSGAWQSMMRSANEPRKIFRVVLRARIRDYQ